MVTFRLADALPASILSGMAADHTSEDERRAGIEASLDAGRGSCVLGDPRIAAMVQEAILHFDGERYRLLTRVIMPNHVHVLIETLPGHSLSVVLQSWKSNTAKAANKLLGRSGVFLAERLLRPGDSR